MCATDLDLELEFSEDETENDQARAPRPVGGQASGVAWGLAKRHDDQDLIAGIR
jgi:hypothetical protein